VTDQRDQYQRLLRDRVGGFFRNTVLDPRLTCAVCRAPKETGRLCRRCAKHRALFAGRLADNVLILAYARGQAEGSIHQSAHTMLAYKQTPPAHKCAQDLALMIRAATDLHSDCVEAHCGGAWSSVTFVPSHNRPNRTHPLAQLAKQVARNNRTDNRFLLEIGPGFNADPQRSVRADRFTVPDEFAERVTGRHVLLIEDTWVTGAKAQSAAVTLHDAGAARVSVLCVARWCRADRPAHKTLLERCTLPYDALICPITGGAC
jgi:predicted amidophosphoribosyltransferase